MFIKPLVVILVAIAIHAAPLNERVAVLENEIKTLHAQLKDQEAYIGADMAHKRTYHDQYLESTKTSDYAKWRTHIIDGLMLTLIGGGPILKRLKQGR